MKIKFCKNFEQGFTLVEVAIVLVILGFVLGALLLPLQAQRQSAAQAQTENTLENARQAILGFAQSKGRLPCPATNNGTGTFPDDTANENPVNGGVCNKQQGFLPAAMLGIQPTDSQGFAVDAWNNRIRYAVTQADNPNGVIAGLPVGYGVKGIPDFTKSSELQDIGISRTNPPPPTPNNAPALNSDLKVCESSTNCSASVYLVNNAVAVIFSTGKNFGQTSGVDETANLAATTTFYSRAPTAATAAPSKEFDDMVVWISPFVLYNAMIQAGQLH
jgi:prepilin-type N-terminal cleavage/methylation domain-containing protein